VSTSVVLPGAAPLQSERLVTSAPVALMYVYAFHAGIGVETPGINFAGNFGVGDLALALAALLMSLRNARVTLTLPFFVPVVLGVLSTMSWGFSVLLGPDHFDPSAWGFVVRWFTYALLLLILPSILTDRRMVWRMLAAFAMGVTAQIVLAWLAWSLAPRYQWFSLPLLASETYNANTIGFYLSCGVPVLLAFLIRSQRITTKLLLGVTLAACAASAFLTASKATWGTVGLILLGVILLRALMKPVLLLVLVSLAGVTYIAVTAAGYHEILGAAVKARWQVSEGSNLQRLEMVQAAGEMATDYPLLGAGPKAYQAIGARYGRHERDPHNSYVGLAAEIGLAAALTFAVTFWLIYPAYVVAAGLRMRRLITPEAIALGGFLAAVLLQGLVTGLPASDKGSWLMLGLAAAYFRFSAPHTAEVRSS
jgi:O-antigen ligase